MISSAHAREETDTITIQNSEGAETSMPSMESGFASLVPMLLIFAVFYFLLIRPQDKRRRLQEALVLGVKKGEDILTNAGLFGKVMSINDSDNTIMVRVAKDVEMKMLKSSIADIVSRTKPDGDKKDSKKGDKQEADKKNPATKAKPKKK
ncbi:MAG: preprotein translocase subunit YajC [Rickettsiales bacterium]|nr:MAG: preprotein translocase subunit YajC [Rickettsiales bacterium]